MVGYVFERFELKYLLRESQYLQIRKEAEARLSPDTFGETTIQSLYYDTDDYRLIRSSLEKPIFKEKLRLRCYGQNTDDRDVYLEMKRKCDGTVYKRRIACKEGEAAGFANGLLPDSQIGRELSYFFDFYGSLAPKMMILYDRSAFFDPASDLRVTFDRNIRYRTDLLSCSAPLTGTPLLEEGSVLMELKAGAAYPLWLCRLLESAGAVKTSFSKYGAAYEREYRLDRIQIPNIQRRPLCLNPLSKTEPSMQPAFSSL